MAGTDAEAGPDAHPLNSYVTRVARQQYARLIDVLNLVGREEDARRCADVAVAQGFWVNPFQRPAVLVEGLPQQARYDIDNTTLAHTLRAHYAEIREEVDQAFRGEDWSDDGGLVDVCAEAVELFMMGRPNALGCRRFPITAQILAAVPEVSARGPGVVSMSRLPPGGRIPAHCGRSNAIVRVHFGIKAPPGAHMRVGTEIFTWEEAHCLGFDDSFEHEVWHDGDSDRVVLIMDMWNPALDPTRTAALMRSKPQEEELLEFLRERGVREVELRDGDLHVRPDQPTELRITELLQTLDAVGVRLSAEEVEWRRTPGD